MGALPKHKTSTYRKGRRRHSFSHPAPETIVCPHCNQAKRPHYRCEHCGQT